MSSGQPDSRREIWQGPHVSAGTAAIQVGHRPPEPALQWGLGHSGRGRRGRFILHDIGHARAFRGSRRRPLRERWPGSS